MFTLRTSSWALPESAVNLTGAERRRFRFDGAATLCNLTVWVLMRTASPRQTDTVGGGRGASIQAMIG